MTCTVEKFEKDIADHTMKVIRDEGHNRHLSFSKNGSSCYQFDLITWRGHLCVTGDCGTYVFERVADMFEFFRKDRINAGYWGEKILSVCRNGGYKEFDGDKFIKVVKSYTDDWEFDDEEDREEAMQQVEDDLLSVVHDGNGEIAIAVANNFSYVGSDSKCYQFDDIWDHGCDRYTYHYIWCLEAIIAGIKMYDESLKDEGISA